MNFQRIIFGVTAQCAAELSDHVSKAVRGLAHAGFDARVLVTDGDFAGDRSTSSWAGVRVDSIPRADHDYLADVWLSLIRYLEESAPCVYVTSQDWIGAMACSRLSNRVGVVGVLHADTSEEYERCGWAGEFWNAVVVLDPALRQRIIGEYPVLAARLAQMPAEIPTEQQLARSYAAVFATISGQLTSGLYRRRQTDMPRLTPGLIPGTSDDYLKWQTQRVNAVPLWPDLPAKQRATVRTSASKATLRDHRIVIAVPTGRVSGVDVFSISLARALIAQGYRAELVQTAPDAPVADRLPMPDDVPAEALSTRPFPTWRERWAAMRAHLEERGPCIYIPNYDTRHSCVIPTLSPRVKVLGIGHSDDAQHYSHILRLASYWDAIVAVSPAVADTLTSLAPGIEPRLHTVPYGVPVRANLPERRNRKGPLSVVYTGRVVRFQKRAMDLVSIARCLRDSGIDFELTVAGSGSELMEFLEAAGPLLLSRHMRYVGPLANEQVIDLVSQSDVFVLPSSFEGLPVSLLEAMANGCVPVVSAIRSGVPEVVDEGENGFTVPIGGVGQFANRISRLANDDTMLARMRANAHRTIREKFSIETMTSAYLEVLEKMVAEPFVRPHGRVMPPPGLRGIQAMMPRFPMPIRRAVWNIRSKGG